MKKDMVNSPSHYTMGKIEVIEAIEDWSLNFHRGQVVKYVARAGRKDLSKEVEDLEKAKWYLEREIARLKENDKVVSSASEEELQRLAAYSGGSGRVNRR